MRDDPYRRALQALRDRGSTVQERGPETASVQCPVHGDNRASATVSRGDRQDVVFNCKGCDATWEDFRNALGLDREALGGNAERTVWTTRGDAVAVYPYRDENGTLLYDVCRTADKQFPVRVPDATTKSGYRWKMGDTRRVLYRLPELIAAVAAGRPIFVCEGEKDVATLVGLGLDATCNPGGAGGGWRPEYSEFLRGANVMVIADADTNGRKHARKVRDALTGVAATVEIAEPAEGCKDATDHVAKAGGLEGLRYEDEVDHLGLADAVTVQLDEPARAAAQESKIRVLLTKASAIRMRGTRWIYRGRIPHGMVTLLAGREGIGKSTVSLDIAARLTRGILPGRYEGKPQSVIVCATEDSWSHTIVPRLMAVGADMDRVFHIAVENEDGGQRAIIAPQDIRRMEQAFRDVTPALMLIDPLMAVIDGSIDTHKQAEVQQALEPLVKMCERIGMAVLAVIHVNKSNGTDPLNNIMGSKAFATLPRSVLYCLEEDEGQFMFCHVKCNVGPKMPSIGYRLQPVRFELEPAEVDDGDDPFITSSRVVWGDEDVRTATEMLEAKATSGNLGPAALAVIALLDAEPGVLTTQQINDKLAGQFDEAAVRNALSRLVKTGRIGKPTRAHYQSNKIT